ncbi:putative RPM1 interacting protein 4 [Quillaja saponaria]|uniref:RPM1 interacting protein 4 n=1 Tax=Quillaja saponaria TaxID=32244 RepID=A0AAD7M0X9_QUISA|nr:putative RPM1 interacting protein 4 [Quillaja saponaria]
MASPSPQWKRSHVPKFGAWDSDNIPYTTYFENARKEKTRVKMNPNDPEENPLAFMMSMNGAGASAGGDHGHEIHTGHVHADNKTTHPINSHEPKNRDGRRHHHARPPSNQRSTTSESGSEKSNSDFSLLPPSQHRAKSYEKKNMTSEGSMSSSSTNSFSSSTKGGHAKQKKTGSHPHTVNNHHRTLSVLPKFGDWDEKDSRSGEGFTVIFDRVKQEKANAAASLPIPPPIFRVNKEDLPPLDPSSVAVCFQAQASDYGLIAWSI